MALSPTAPSLSPATPRGAVAEGAALALAAVWGLAGICNASTLSALGIINLLLLLVLLAAGAAGVRRSASAAAGEMGRLGLVAVFLLAGALLSPGFQKGIAAETLERCLAAAKGAPLDPASRLRLLTLLLPVLCAGLIWIFAPRRNACAPEDKWERFFCKRNTRVNLVLVGTLLAGLELGLSGGGIKVLALRAVTLAAALAALGPLLRLTRPARGARTLAGVLAASLAVSAGIGCLRYASLVKNIDAGNTLLAENKPDEARPFHDRARELNRTLAARGPELRMETGWAQYHERMNQFWDAQAHWQQIAGMQQIDRNKFLPLQRLQCKLGDSVTPWRRLVFDGFPAITHPELAPGIKTMADIAVTDVRAQLLAALLAWELNEPPAECRRRLENVQRAAPGEPASYALLRRMGVKMPNVPMALPLSLMVGARPTEQSAAGTLGELGELRAVVVLDPGHYDVTVNAHGTPLDEEWPVIALQLDEHEAGRTQVGRYEDHDIRFSFDVNQGNLYRLRLVFANRKQEIYQERMAMRGLTVNSITLNYTAK